ncbi:hypothetical protein [Chengkuizengella marina]|uniref:Lipoprotein n=1 Tax=Chengkuizengella marina TaxID=2507566 RepID=A0A6N9Q0Z1_9BACL|nr:hypothetical protein [Chengkuizengella marina]NBI28997.1 hypothetical protein [Chengkuizengella marina]
MRIIKYLLLVTMIIILASCNNDDLNLQGSLYEIEEYDSIPKDLEELFPDTNKALLSDWNIYSENTVINQIKTTKMKFIEKNEKLIPVPIDQSDKDIKSYDLTLFHFTGDYMNNENKTWKVFIGSYEWDTYPLDKYSATPIDTFSIQFSSNLAIENEVAFIHYENSDSNTTAPASINNGVIWDVEHQNRPVSGSFMVSAFQTKKTDDNSISTIKYVFNSLQSDRNKSQEQVPTISSQLSY